MGMENSGCTLPGQPDIMRLNSPMPGGTPNRLKPAVPEELTMHIQYDEFSKKVKQLESQVQHRIDEHEKRRDELKHKQYKYQFVPNFVIGLLGTLVPLFVVANSGSELFVQITQVLLSVLNAMNTAFTANSRFFNWAAKAQKHKYQAKNYTQVLARLPEGKEKAATAWNISQMNQWMHELLAHIENIAQQDQNIPKDPDEKHEGDVPKERDQMVIANRIRREEALVLELNQELESAGLKVPEDVLRQRLACPDIDAEHKKIREDAEEAKKKVDALEQRLRDDAKQAQEELDRVTQEAKTAKDLEARNAFLQGLLAQKSDDAKRAQEELDRATQEAKTAKVLEANNRVLQGRLDQMYRETD